MEMVGQHDGGNNIERMTLPQPSFHRPQMIDMTHQQITLSIGEIDGEEIRPAFDKGAPISHGR